MLVPTAGWRVNARTSDARPYGGDGGLLAVFVAAKEPI